MELDIIFDELGKFWKHWVKILQRLNEEFKYNSPR